MSGHARCTDFPALWKSPHCEAREKIVEEQTNTIPQEDLRGEVHEEKAGKTWTSFLECVTFQLQSVFRPDAAEAVKFYITNTLKKPKRWLALTL